MSTMHQDVLNMIKLFRKYLSSLPGCERITLCGADCMLRILQLSMAEVHKQSFGEFTVALSDVLETWKYFLHDKLGLQHKMKEPEDYAAFRNTYDLFLKNSNMLDLIDVYRGFTELEVASTFGPSSPVKILEFISDGFHSYGEQGQVPNTISTPSNGLTQNNIKLRSVMKRILCAYLNLLVNSKNDLALALILNVPDRGLGRDAFRDLRHAARSKQMSLFLVATSFIRTIELGGKGYAPSESDPLRKHVKGLTSFVNFIDKLDEMLGEISDPRNAVGRILSTIKMNLLRGRSSGDRYCGAAMDVVHDLELRIQNIINDQQSAVHDLTTGISPARPKVHAINHGTASCGRDTVKALLVLLDEEAASPPIKNKADILCVDEENASFFGEDSVLTLFRSPEQANESSPKSLRHRVQKSMDGRKEKLKQTLIRSQFACTYKDDQGLHRKLQDFPSMSQIPTCVHPAPKLVSVLCFDEEPLSEEPPLPTRPALAQASGNVLLGRLACSKGNSDKKLVQKSSKRKQVNLCSENLTCEEPPHKKTVSGVSVSRKQLNKVDNKLCVGGKANKAAAKKKLIAGQAKLTSFFRL
ncbi:PCNA-interacting partner [Pleurodeles waltl]|uniref:PCNA-interacting partner n=1 Tax=Pleurodeles waltl TaxID=8319 RepID=UPI003709A5FF